MKPEVLLFDEPTSALDPEIGRGCIRYYEGTCERRFNNGLFVTHEMQFAREVSDVVCFMDQGVVAEMGTPEEVFEHPKQNVLNSSYHVILTDKIMTQEIA